MAFAAVDYPQVCHFAIDTEKLALYREAMLNSGVENADLAVTMIFDTQLPPCEYSGTITVSRPMASHRATDSIISKTWECYMVQFFDSSYAQECLNILNRSGPEAAVRAMYNSIQWKADYITKKI